MAAEVAIAYQAREQFSRLSAQERTALACALNSAAEPDPAERHGKPARFVSTFGPDMGACWTRDGSGVVVLSIVRRGH